MMAAFSIFVYSIVCLTVAAGGNHRPFGRDRDTFQCPSEGFHPDPNDCRIFYRCVDWSSNVFFRNFNEPTLTPFQFTCGEGTVFDPVYNICNYPDQTLRKKCAGQGSGRDASNSQYPFTYPSSSAPGNEYPGYPLQEVNRNYPESYPNEYENQISPDGDVTQSSSGECSDEGFFPIPGDCARFMRCADNGMGSFRKFVFRCGEGTVWDQQTLVCNHPSSVARCGESQSVLTPDLGGYPEDGNPLEYPQSGEQEKRPDQSGYPQENYPKQGGYPDTQGNQGEYPATAIRPSLQNQGYPGQGYSGYESYPTSGNQPGGQYQGYPQQQSNRPPANQQGNSPGLQDGYPNQGGHRAPANTPPGQNQGSKPPTNQQNRPNQSGYPQQSGYPNKQNQGGYPTRGNQPQNQGYPEEGSKPPVNHQNQGNRPGPPHYPGQQNQGNYPTSGYLPSRQNEAYSKQHQGGRPPINQQNRPDKSGYPQQGGYPGNQSYGPNQAAYPQQLGYPNRPAETYPHQEQPDQGNPPENSNQIPLRSPNGCQSDGFFSVLGDCMKFYRCVNNGRGGYMRYDFTCGPGTVWDQELTTCNHPWAIQRTDCSIPGGFDMNGDFSPDMQQAGFGQSPSRPAIGQPQKPLSNQNQMTTRPAPTQQTPSYQNQMTTRPATTQQTPSYQNQMSSQTTLTQQSTPRPVGQTTQTGTTEGSQDESTTPNTPFGGRPSKPDRNQLVKCEKEGFYPVPGNCKKFYRCVDWDGDKGERFSVFFFECGEGTIWDPALRTCNYEESVYPPRDCSMEKNNQTTSATTMATQTTESTTPENTNMTPQEESTSSRPAESTESMTTVETTELQETTSEQTDKPTEPDSGISTESSSPTKPGSSSSIEPGSTNPTEPGSTSSTEPGSTSPTEPGSTSPTEPGSTSPTEPGSTNPTEPGSTSPTEPGSTNPTEPGSTSPTEPGSTNPIEPGSTSPTEAGTSNPTEPGGINSTEPATDEDNNHANRPGESNSDCPAPEEGQVLFVCPTGFRRHPKDCNLFYQCTISKEGDVNIMTFTCKNESVYDERKIQCLPPEETEPCPSKSKGRGRYTRRVEPELTSVVPIASTESLCPREGHFPYDGNCHMFFKCKKDYRGRMQGYLYQCQSKHIFSPETGLCERSSTTKKCFSSVQYLTATNLKWMTSKVPIEYFDVR